MAELAAGALPDPTCDHPDFAAVVDVNRLSDVGAFAADIRIRCLACDEPFVFIGSLGGGVSPLEPTVSVAGTELRAPIQPRSWGRTGLIAYPGFSVKAVPHG